MRVIESLVRHAVAADFDEHSAGKPVMNSSASLSHDLGRIQICASGRISFFGHKRSGNGRLAENAGANWAVPVHGLAAVSLDEQIVTARAPRNTELEI